ncbi:hypothetical protein A9Q68_10035 [Streptococcus bovimastitidis]|uniref:Uncharacterized protein n=1 Tax=Streptococcus bovimastitidis TaxID=1856638 RepID=A0A1L8MK68_9STRE|nr:hypothetical protein [Streptococcus bovimastitidis]OJF71167.1 hypothetical protein A9Q68_10035 [Streptococcus bovimastitidis]
MNKRQKKKKDIEKSIAEINRSLKIINQEILDIEIVESRNCLATNKEFSSIKKAIVDQQELTYALSEALAELQDYVLNDLTNKRPFWQFWK